MAAESTSCALPQFGDILDHLQSHVAVLDHAGRIVYVNEAWRRFGAENGLTLKDAAVGADYLGACGGGSLGRAIGEVLNGTRQTYFHSYPCHSPTTRRWYQMRVSRLETDGGVFVLVSHDPVTEIQEQAAATQTQARELEERVARQQHLLDQMHDAMVLTDLDAFVTGWNKGAERLFGYRSQEILGHSLSEIFGKKSPMSVRDELMRPLLRDGQIERELVLTRKFGQPFFAHVSFSLIHDSKGRPEGMLGYMLDISRRKHAEAAVRRSHKMLEIIHEAQSRFIIDGKPHLLVSRLLESIVALVEAESGVLVELTGTEEEHALGLEFRGMVFPSGATHLQEFYAARSETGMAYDDLGELLLSALMTGRTVTLHGPEDGLPGVSSIARNHPPVRSFLGMPLFCGKSLMGMMLLFNREEGFTESSAEFLQPVAATCANLLYAHRFEKRQAQTAAILQESESRFRAVLNHAPVAILSVDKAGTLTFVNNYAAGLFGYRREDLEGTAMERLLPERHRVRHRDLFAAYRHQPTARALGGGRPLPALHADGHEFSVRIGLNAVTLHGEERYLAYILPAGAEFPLAGDGTNGAGGEN